jgi:hypothetical protein
MRPLACRSRDLAFVASTALGGAVAFPRPGLNIARSIATHNLAGVNLTAKWIAVTALAAERPPAPSAREPRVPMAFPCHANRAFAIC